MDGRYDFSRDHSRLLASSGFHATHAFTSMEATHHPHGSTMRTAFADLGRPSSGVSSTDPTALTAAALQSRFLSAALPFSGASSFPFLGGMLTSSMPASPSSPFRTPPANVANMRQFWPPTPPPDGYGRFNMSAGNFYNLLPSMGSLVPPSDNMPYSGHGMISRLAPSTHYHHLLDAHKDSNYFSPNLNLGAPLTPTTLVPPLSSFSPAIDRQSSFGHLSPGMKGGVDGGRRPLGGAEESNASNNFWRMDAELEGFLKRETPSRHSSSERSAKQQSESQKAESKRSEKREPGEVRKANNTSSVVGGKGEAKGGGEVKGCKSRDAPKEKKPHAGSGEVKCSNNSAVHDGPLVFSTNAKPLDQPARSTPLQQIPSLPEKTGSESNRNIGGGHYPPSDGIVERRVPTSNALGVSKVVESQTPPVVTMTTTAATSNSTRSATSVTYSHALRVQEPRDCRPSSEKQQPRVPTTATTPVSSSSFSPLKSSSSPPVISQALSVTVPHTSNVCVQNASAVSVKCSCASPKPPVQSANTTSVSDSVVHKNSVNISSVQCSKVCTVISSCASQSTADVCSLSSTSIRTSSESLANRDLHAPQSAAINLSIPSQIVSPNSSSSLNCSKSSSKVNRKEAKRNSPVPHGVASVYTSQQWTHQSSDPHASHSYSSWDMGNPSAPQCPKVHPRSTSQCCKNIESKTLSGTLPASGKVSEKNFSVDAIKLKKETEEKRQDCQFAQKSQLGPQRQTNNVCSASNGATLRPNTVDNDDNNCAINLTIGNKIPKSEPKDFSCNQHNQQQDTALSTGSAVLQRTQTSTTTSSSLVTTTTTLSTSMSTVSDSRGTRQKSIVQGSPISWIAPQIQARASPSNAACSNKPIAVQPVSTITSSQRTTGRVVKEIHSTVSSKQPHSAKTHAPLTIKSNLSNRTRAETTISRLCRNATISSTVDGSVKIATPGGEMNVLQQSAKTTTITLPGGVVAATANTSIPIGIAVAQQRQDPSNISSGVKHNSQPPVSAENLQRFSETRPLENNNVCDQNELVRSQKPMNIQEPLTRPTQVITTDATNCLVSTGTALQSNQWESEVRTTLPTQWVAHTPVVTPTVWVGQGAYAPAPTNTATTVPTVSLGPLDTSHLSIPPGGYQLARDPITGHLFLIPTANIVSHTELVDRTSMWSTYTTTTAPVHLQQLVTQPQQQTQFQQQIVAQMETGKLQVTELTESTVCTITVSDTVEGRDRERESQQSQELVAKRESKDTKTVGTSPSALIAGIPIATGQPFTYSAFPAPAPAPAVSYYYEPTVVHLTHNQATTAIQTEPGKRSQGTSPLNPATPSPPLQIASEQGVQTCSPEDNMDDLEDFGDDCDRETQMEVTHVKSGHEMGVTTATQVDFDAQTSSEDNDFEERKVEVQDSANQTESPLIGTPKDDLSLDESSSPFEPIERENSMMMENLETKSSETALDDLNLNQKEKCEVTDDTESAPVLPAESEPVMEFIDHHGLNLLVDSIEEFTAREQEAHQETNIEENAQESQKESSQTTNAVDEMKKTTVAIEPTSESTPSLPRLDPGCTDGLGLLCALAEQRFLEESLNAQHSSKESNEIQSEKQQEKIGVENNSATKLDINSNYEPIIEKGSEMLTKSASHVQVSVSTSSEMSFSIVNNTTPAADNTDLNEGETKMQLAELQRKSKRKQRELIRMQPKKDESIQDTSPSSHSEEVCEPPKKKKKVDDAPLLHEMRKSTTDINKSKEEERTTIPKMVISTSQHASSFAEHSKAKKIELPGESKQNTLPLTPVSSSTTTTATSFSTSTPPSLSRLHSPSPKPVTMTVTSNRSNLLPAKGSTILSPISNSSSKSHSSDATKKEQTNKELKAAASSPVNSGKSIQSPATSSKPKTQNSTKSSHHASMSKKNSVENKKKISNSQVTVKTSKSGGITSAAAPPPQPQQPVPLTVKKETEQVESAKQIAPAVMASTSGETKDTQENNKEQEQNVKKGIKRPADTATVPAKQLKTTKDTNKGKDTAEMKVKKAKTDDVKKNAGENTKTPVFNDDAWNRRRSERIFLHDAGVVPQSSVASYNDIPVIGQKSHTSSQTKSAENLSTKTDSAAAASGSAKSSKSVSKSSDSANKSKKPKQQKKEIPPAKKIKTKETKEICKEAKPQEKKEEKEKVEKEQKEKAVPDDLFAALKKCRLTEGQTCGLSPINSDAENIEASSSEGENIPLSALADRYASELRSSTVTLEDLKDNQRVLTLVDGLFYAGAISAIQPPDIYGIVLDGERGNRPRIYSQEEILKESILEIKPTMMKHLPEGSRVCAYWSQQYRCLYPGTVAKATSPNPASDKNLVYVEFDDGDSGKIPLEDIRLLPADYPVVEVEPNPLLLLGKRRQRTGESTESKTSSTAECIPPASSSSEKTKVKKLKKQVKSSKKKSTSTTEEGKQDDLLSDDVFHSKPSCLKSQLNPKNAVGDNNKSCIMSLAPSSTCSSSSVQSANQIASVQGKTITKSSQKESEKEKETKTTSKKKSKKSKNESKMKSKDKCHDKCPKGESGSQDGKSSKKHKKHKDDHKHRHRRHHRHCRHRHRHKKHKHEKKSSNSSIENREASLSSSSLSSSPLVSTAFSTVPSLSSSSSSSSSTAATSMLSSSSLSSSSSTMSSAQSSSSHVVLASSPHKSPAMQKQTPDSNKAAQSSTEVSKKSELTVKIKTSLSELACGTEPSGTKEQKSKATAVVVNESSSDSSSDSSDTSDSSDEETVSSEVQHASSSSSKKTSKTGQKSKNNRSSSSSASQKPAKRRDRIPSVEKSKIAAFLPARQLWRWSGKSFRRHGTKGKAKKEFYKEITRGKETIKVGDSAVFLSTGRPHLPYIGRIETMWQSWGGNMVVKVRWFYHPEETKGEQRLSDPKGALFESPHMDENDVQTISHKCEVLSWEEYNKHKEQEASQGGSMYGSIFDNNDIYYLAGTYDPTVGVVVLKPGIS